MQRNPLGEPGYMHVDSPLSIAEECALIREKGLDAFLETLRERRPLAAEAKSKAELQTSGERSQYIAAHGADAYLELPDAE